MPPKRQTLTTARSVGMAVTNKASGGIAAHAAQEEATRSAVLLLKRPAASALSPLLGQSSSKKLRDITNVTPLASAVTTNGASGAAMQLDSTSYGSGCKEVAQAPPAGERLCRSDSSTSAVASSAATAIATSAMRSTCSAGDASLGTVSTRAPTTDPSKACSSATSTTLGRDWEAASTASVADLLGDDGGGSASVDEAMSRDSWASELLGNLASRDSWPPSSLRGAASEETPTPLPASFPTAGPGSLSLGPSPGPGEISSSGADAVGASALAHRSSSDKEEDDGSVLFDADDPQCVGEYLDKCWEVLASEEAPICPTGVRPKTPGLGGTHDRSIIVDWLAQVQTRYRMRAETLFLAVSLYDRFLTVKRVAQREVKLVGVTAVFIAAKFEEIYPPEVRDFVFLTEQACTRDAILQMEVRMLVTLDFKIALPTPAHFVERFARANRCGEAHRYLIHYVVELTLMDARLNRYTPSHLASAAVLVSNRLLKARPGWPAATATVTGRSEQSIRKCAREMMAVIQAAETSPLQAVRRKYMKPEFLSVASMTL